MEMMLKYTLHSCDYLTAKYTPSLLGLLIRAQSTHVPFPHLCNKILTQNCILFILADFCKSFMQKKNQEKKYVDLRAKRANHKKIHGILQGFNKIYIKNQNDFYIYMNFSKNWAKIFKNFRPLRSHDMKCFLNISVLHFF